MTPVGSHVQNASLSSAVPIDVPSAATHVLAQATSQNVRYTLDGSTTATASKGNVIYAGDPPALIPVPGGGVWSVIEEAASATIEYQFAAIR